MRMMLSFTAKQRLIDYLYTIAKSVVSALNQSIDKDILYITACAGMWSLYGRVKDDAPDKLLSWGVMDVDSLVKLIGRLSEGLEL